MRAERAGWVVGAGLLLLASAVPAWSADQTLQEAAAGLARNYDAHYNARDAAAMAGLYAADGVLVSPAGPLVRGRADLKPYYEKRFAAGARNHHTAISEVHAVGTGGYGIGTFSVDVPQPDGKMKHVSGNIADVYVHDPDGWHLAAVVPSVPPPAK